MLPQNVKDILSSNPAQGAIDALATKPIDQTPTSDAPDTTAGQSALNPNAPAGIPGGATMEAQLRGKGSSFLNTLLPSSGASQMKTPSPTVQKIMAGANEAATAAGPAASAPGGWARALVAGVGTGLSQATESLSDASHATDNLRPGQGALKGIFNTLAARSNRQAAQKEQLSKEKTADALRAETFARTIQIQQNISKSTEEQRMAAYDRTQKNIDLGKDQYETKENMTPDMMSEMQKSDPDFWKHWHGGVVREQPVIDADGKPVLDPKTGKPEVIPMFSIQRNLPKSGVDEKVKVTAADAADFNHYLGRKDIPEGSELTNDELQLQRKKVSGAMLTEHQLNEGREQALTDQQNSQIQQDRLDPTIQGYTSNPKGALSGLMQGKKNTEDHMALINKQYDQMADKIKSLAAQDPTTAAASLKLLEQKRQEDLQPLKTVNDRVNRLLNTYNEKDRKTYTEETFGTDNIVELGKDLSKADGPHAAEISADIQEQIKQDPNMSPEKKQQLQQLQQRADAKSKASLDFTTDKKLKEVDAEQKASEGDMSGLKDMVLKYDYDPDKLFSRFKGMKEKQKFLADIHETDPAWSEAKYKQRYNMQQDLAKITPKSMGGQVQSLNQFSLHAGEANRSIQGLRNLGSPILNTPINKVKQSMVGFAEAQRFKIAAEATKSEYLNFINNGFVPPSDAELRMADAVSMDHTPAELQETFRAMAHLVAARGHSMNGRYATIMGGGDIPGLLQPDSESILKQFGIDTNAITTSDKTTNMSAPINKASAPAAPAAPPPGSPQAPKGGINPMVSEDGKTQIWQLGNQWVTADGKPYKP